MAFIHPRILTFRQMPCSGSISLPLTIRFSTHLCSFLQPPFDLSCLSDAAITKRLKENALARECPVDFDRLLELHKRHLAGEQETRAELMSLINQLPNRTHPLTPIGDASKAKLIHLHGAKPVADWKLKNIVALCSDSAPCTTMCSTSDGRPTLCPAFHLRCRGVSAGAGPRTYYFGGCLAQLERALVSYTLRRLSTIGFTLISVPDILPEHVVEACGFSTRGDRSQVYKLCSEQPSSQHCLSGTSEMALAGFCADRTLDSGSSSDPDALGLCAVSRCFRQEAPRQEALLYRVHQFTKVEMFAVTKPELAVGDAMFDKILNLQISLFADLGLHFKVLEMPTTELGNSAYRKVDIEAWMPGESAYGEISSTSNCLDYQSKRLNIRWSTPSGDNPFAYTLNGTACAVPRMMKAIIETHQNKDGTIRIPEVLVPILKQQGALPSSKTEAHFKRAV
ncbi:unnamed protein product [Dicrocoelium dendriticum]|nr:unnamed protein product [Dicrocoelium dendriticum]